MPSKLLLPVLAYLFFASPSQAQHVDYLGIRLGFDNTYLQEDTYFSNRYQRQTVLGDTTFEGHTWFIYRGCTLNNPTDSCYPGNTTKISYTRFSQYDTLGFTIQTTYTKQEGQNIESRQGWVPMRDTAYIAEGKNVTISFPGTCATDGKIYRDCMTLLRTSDSTRQEVVWVKGIGMVKSETMNQLTGGDEYRRQTLISAAPLSARRATKAVKPRRERNHEINGRVVSRQLNFDPPRF